MRQEDGQWFSSRLATLLMPSSPTRRVSSMHPLDVQETNRSGEPVAGLEPPASLETHALLALQMLRTWLGLLAKGIAVRTSSGDRRVMPYSLRLLARQYVYDHLDEAHFATPLDMRYARRYYTYAMEVQLGHLLETLAIQASAPEIGTRNRARPWMAVARQLGLEQRVEVP